MCPGMVLVQRVTGRTRNTARGWYDTRKTASVETSVTQTASGNVLRVTPPPVCCACHDRKKPRQHVLNALQGRQAFVVRQLLLKRRLLCGFGGSTYNACLALT